MTKEDTIKQGENPHVEARQGIPTGDKESQDPAKEFNLNILLISPQILKYYMANE